MLLVEITGNMNYIFTETFESNLLVGVKAEKRLIS